MYALSMRLELAGEAKSLANRRNVNSLSELQVLREECLEVQGEVRDSTYLFACTRQSRLVCGREVPIPISENNDCRASSGQIRVCVRNNALSSP